MIQKLRSLMATSEKVNEIIDVINSPLEQQAIPINTDDFFGSWSGVLPLSSSSVKTPLTSTNRNDMVLTNDTDINIKRTGLYGIDHTFNQTSTTVLTADSIISLVAFKPSGGVITLARTVYNAGVTIKHFKFRMYRLTAGDVVYSQTICNGNTQINGSIEIGVYYLRDV